MTSVPTGLLIGDCRETLRAIPDGSVHCCVTSPPYWGLRDYGADGQIGLEHTVDQYVAEIVAVFREVRRVLRHDGTLWLNLGDSYAGSGKGGNPEESPHQKQRTNARSLIGQTARDAARTMLAGMDRNCGFKPKDLIGVPWRVAFALQADGWYLRQDIIWHKPNPMPESVRDRCTKAHEYIFLLSKSERYYFDAKAIEEESVTARDAPRNRWDRDYEPPPGQKPQKRPARSGNVSRKAATERGCPEDGVDGNVPWEGFTRNKRSVWTVSSARFKGAHFATYPPKLIEPCILAGCPEKCCSDCGAPHERVVERTKSFESGSGKSRNAIAGKQDLSASSTNSTPDIRMGPVIHTRTIGRRSTCNCSGGIAEGTVLDPFMGSGTTAVVAEKMGRRWSGCELSEKYAAIIRKRLAREGTPIFAGARNHLVAQGGGA